MILVFNHYIACVWYSLAFYRDINDMTWLSADEFVDAPYEHRYVAALHWSLTQFTPSTNNIVPANAGERLFAICVVIFALIMFSFFISSIASALAKLAALRSQ